MYSILQPLHSYWAYLVLILVLVATVNAIAGVFSKKEFKPTDAKLALFALVATHIQFLIGIILFFVSPLGLQNIQNSGMGAVMKDSVSRLYAVEHPMVMLLAVIFITIGYSSHKKKLLPAKKFKTIMIFYLLALIFILSRLPWAQWLA